MKELKIGRRVIEIKEGDYILDNKVCYQLISGDGRSFFHVGFERNPCVTIPKTTMKTIDLTKLVKKQRKYSASQIYDVYIF